MMSLKAVFWILVISICVINSVSENPDGVYGFKAKKLDETEVSMSDYKGKVLLIVDVAFSIHKAKFEFDRLHNLHDKYSSRGLEILGFPTYECYADEPDTRKGIEAADRKFHVNFPMFAQIKVNGHDTPPLWKHLKSESGIDYSEISNTFTQFIVNRDGKVAKMYFVMVQNDVGVTDEIIEMFLDDPKLIDIQYKNLNID